MPDKSHKSPFFAGVDVGGTNVKVGIVDDDGQIIADTKFPTEADDSPDVAVEQAKKELTELLAGKGLDWEQVAAVGVGTPGPMDVKAGFDFDPQQLARLAQLSDQRKTQPSRQQTCDLRQRCQRRCVWRILGWWWTGLF